jgi:hypothetical protein
MPAGGTWTARNKRRPGAYINFISVPSIVSTIGERGTVAVALPMTWGDDTGVIRLTGAELLSGTSLPKIGVTATDGAASLPFRAALSGCYNALFYRLDSGATAASAVIRVGDLVATAKYKGTTGDDISVVITENSAADNYTVGILHKGIQRETFTVTTLAEFNSIDSDWVEFSVPEEPGSSEIPTTAGISLTGATDGTESSQRYDTFFEALEHEQFQCLAIQTTEESAASSIMAQVTLWRELRGKKVQGVVYTELTSMLDYEGIISVHQGFTVGEDEIGTDLFPVWVASMSAGANVNESLTATVIPDAKNIVNPVAEEDIDEALATGRFIITYRQDGKVCVEQDINSLYRFTADKNYAFSKNRVIRCLDYIGNNTTLIFNRNYCGKVNNDNVGRNQYKGELISMVDNLMNIGAVTNFGGAEDIVVLPGETVDAVVVGLDVQPIDSMEKLYMTVNVDA